MYHTRNFLNSLSEAYSGKVHNFTNCPEQLTESASPEVWGTTKSGQPYQRWEAGYVDTTPTSAPPKYDHRRSKVMAAMFGFHPNYKLTKTQMDMLYRVESELVTKGSALLESFDPDDASEILIDYLHNQGLRIDPNAVDEFVDLLEDTGESSDQQSNFSINPQLKRRKRALDAKSRRPRRPEATDDQQGSFAINPNLKRRRKQEDGDQDQQRSFAINRNLKRQRKQEDGDQDQQRSFAINPNLKQKKKQGSVSQDQQGAFELSPRLRGDYQDQQAAFNVNPNLKNKGKRPLDAQSRRGMGTTSDQPKSRTERRPLDAQSRRGMGTTSDQPKSRDERKPQDQAGASDEELRARRERLLRRDRQRNGNALQSLGKSIVKTMQKKDPRPEAAGGDIVGGRSTRIERG